MFVARAIARRECLRRLLGLRIRQCELLRRIVVGKANKVIGCELRSSERTVERMGNHEQQRLHPGGYDDVPTYCAIRDQCAGRVAA